MMYDDEPVFGDDGVTASLGASLGIDVSNPQVAGAIGDVQAQAGAEGASALETQQRVSTLLHQFQGIYSGGNVDAGAALQAAKQYVTQYHSVAGAIDTATGLVGAVEAAASGNATPVDLVQDFTGPVMAAMTTAGAVSAGVGAAIVGGIAIVGALLDAAGIFGTKPQGQNVCGTYMNPPPDRVINCVGLYMPDGPVSPGTPLWRPFPEPTVKGDKAWFDMSLTTGGGFDWHDAHWVMAQSFAQNPRAIDSAFPDYVRLYNESTGGSASDFQKAFFTAWKANKQYWLNGRNGAADGQVLINALRVWNRAHEATSGVDLLSSGGGFINTLIKSAISIGAADLLSSSGQGLRMNTGPLKTRPPGTPVPLHLVGLFGGSPLKKLTSLLGLSGGAVTPGAPPAAAQQKLISMGFRGISSTPVESKLSKYAPFAPAVVGVALFPFLGIVGPVLGGVATVIWKEMKG